MNQALFQPLGLAVNRGGASKHSHHGPFLDHQTSQLHPIITNIEYLLYTEHNNSVVLLVTEQWRTSVPCSKAAVFVFAKVFPEKRIFFSKSQAFQSDQNARRAPPVYITYGSHRRKSANDHTVISKGKVGEVGQCYLVVNA